MFEVPGSDVKCVHITDECVNGHCPPEYIKRKDVYTEESATTNKPEDENDKVRLTQ